VHQDGPVRAGCRLVTWSIGELNKFVVAWGKHTAQKLNCRTAHIGKLVDKNRHQFYSFGLDIDLAAAGFNGVALFYSSMRYWCQCMSGWGVCRDWLEGGCFLIFDVFQFCHGFLWLYFLCLQGDENDLLMYLTELIVYF
jgi:hypothetical protein